MVIGARTEAQLADNLGAADDLAGAPLTAAEMDELNALSAVTLPYPYEMVWRACRPEERLDGNLWDRAR